MFFHKLFRPLSLFILLASILPLNHWGYQYIENNIYPQELRVEAENTGVSVDLLSQDNLAMDFLGKGFPEIKEALGEPDEQGYSSLYGPHNYMLYKHEEGTVRFCAPENMENKKAVSIILEAGQAVLGTEVGMTFAEIKDILGPPAFGPEIGMENKYYMEYFFEEINNQAPTVLVSFSADGINSPTDDVFIKLKVFEYEEAELI